MSDGTYSVEISDNGCKATSNDFIISTNSINDIRNNIGVKNVYDLMGRSLNQYDNNYNNQYIIMMEPIASYS